MPRNFIIWKLGEKNLLHCPSLEISGENTHEASKQTSWHQETHSRWSQQPRFCNLLAFTTKNSSPVLNHDGLTQNLGQRSQHRQKELRGIDETLFTLHTTMQEGAPAVWLSPPCIPLHTCCQSSGKQQDTSSNFGVVYSAPSAVNGAAQYRCPLDACSSAFKLLFVYIHSPCSLVQERLNYYSWSLLYHGSMR